MLAKLLTAGARTSTAFLVVALLVLLGSPWFLLLSLLAQVYSGCLNVATGTDDLCPFSMVLVDTAMVPYEFAIRAGQRIAGTL